MNLERAFLSDFQLEKCLLKANVFNATLESNLWVCELMFIQDDINFKKVLGVFCLFVIIKNL